ncbi:MAG: PAS domain-containing protein [Ferruginibacter sp.]
MKKPIEYSGFFAHIFTNARENCIIIMNTRGIIQEVNQGFVACFGYNKSELKGKHFKILFTAQDRKLKKPETEVELTMRLGFKSDNNYMLQKNGISTYVMGESLKVENEKGETYLVKIIQNIDAQKQLEKFLLNSTEFIDTIFDSIKDTALLILDSELKIIKCNKAFKEIFELRIHPLDNQRLSRTDNAFWRKQEIRKKLLDMIIRKDPIRNEQFSFTTTKGEESVITINSKFINSDENEKQILLVIKKVS